MTKKIVVVLVGIGMVIALIGCGADEESSKAGTGRTQASNVDAVTTASIVNTADDFVEATGPEGTWIIATLNDLTIDQEVVVADEFTNNDELYRKIALYAQDEDRTVTDRYTVTAPRLVVQSPNTRIQSGTFRGDVYVEAEGFHLVDATVDGDVSFATEELRETFEMNESSKVTGTITVGEE
jgi:hypothetical protein